jgi:hypothetical protein
VTALKPDETTTTITVGTGPFGPAIAPAGTLKAGTVYISNNGGHSGGGYTDGDGD